MTYGRLEVINVFFLYLKRIYHHHDRLQELDLMTCSDSEFNFSEFMNLWTVGRTPWTEDQPDTRPLPT